MEISLRSFLGALALLDDAVRKGTGAGKLIAAPDCSKSFAFSRAIFSRSRLRLSVSAIIPGGKKLSKCQVTKIGFEKLMILPSNPSRFL